MRSLRLAALILSLALGTAVATTACSSSGSSKKPAHSAAPSLTAQLKSGLASLTSAHLAASTDYAGQKVTGTGVLRLKDGEIDAADVTEGLPGGLGTIRIVRDAGNTYAKLPPGLAKTSKPWLLITGSSTNPLVAQLSGLIGTVLGIAAPSSLNSFAAAATSVTDKGSATIGGVPTTHYALTVDPKKLPDTLQNSVGTASSLPVDVYLDKSGRPVQISGTFTILGQKVTPTISLSAFNQPVTVTAPPASQVGTT